MQYALLIHEQPEEMVKRTSAEAPAYWAAWSAYSKAVADAGIMRGGAGLELPTTATTMTLAPEGPVLHDGPFADSKEQFGGFYLIEAADLDEALAWAAKVPSPGGKIEVRPLLPPPPAD